MPALEYGSVAGLFGQRGKPPFQPPGQRMEPEDGAIQQGQPLDQGVAAPHVLAFMGQYRVQLRLRPRAPAFRQNHRGTQPSDCDRRGARGARQPAITIPRAPHEGVSTQSAHG